MMIASLPYDKQLAEDIAAIDDFRFFVRLCWPLLESSRSFVEGWHLDALALHLQAVSNGEIKRLLVNMPPRHSKRCGSYALNLATRDNLRHRRIVKHPAFQKRFGRLFNLTKDQDAKMKFETDKGGYRMAVSVGSSATGEGGDILILDDPHNIDEKESDAKREAAIDWFDNTWSTRLNDQQTCAMIVVGQRIHQQDVSGHILERNDGEWVHLNLSAEYEPGTACRTFLPTGKELWHDPRTEEGELLWESRFPRSVIEKAKQTHGALGYSALYQQAPIPPGGYIFNKAHERLFTEEGGVYLLITPFWFEDVGYQSAIAQDLLLEGIPCMCFHPPGDKVTRAGAAAIWQEAGKVYFRKNASWLEEWRNEIYAFPKGAHADQVDNLSMIGLLVRGPGRIGVTDTDRDTLAALRRYRGY